MLGRARDRDAAAAAPAWPVLALLGLAGLLRPEAWLFAGVYWLLSVAAGQPARARAARAALVALAPLLWGLSDLLITGHPLWSLTNTQATARALHRTTGLLNVPYNGARRLGEVLDPDGLLARARSAASLALWLTRARALLGAAAGGARGASRSRSSPSSGLPIQDRYVFLIAALCAVFAGAGLFGWRSLPRRAPAPARCGRRRRCPSRSPR